MYTLHQMDVKTAFLNGDPQEAPFETNPFLLLLAGGQRAFSVLVKEVDIRTSLPVSGTFHSMRREAKTVLISV